MAPVVVVVDNLRQEPFLVVRVCLAVRKVEQEACHVFLRGLEAQRYTAAAAAAEVAIPLLLVVAATLCMVVRVAVVQLAAPLELEGQPIMVVLVAREAQLLERQAPPQAAAVEAGGLAIPALARLVA